MLYADKYFTKSRMIAQKTGNDPIVKYRVFGRFEGMAALSPAKALINVLAPTAKVEILPEGTLIQPRDTIMTIEDKFSNVVELETLYLQWAALPCYTALQASRIVSAAKGKDVLDFHARHLYGDDSVALASYGAGVGGMRAFSTDLGANAYSYLMMKAAFYKSRTEANPFEHSPNKGIGTTPHAIIAIHGGNYVEMAKSYIDTFPDDNFVALIDYNNREIDDTILLLKEFGTKLYGIRIDTSGENVAQGVDAPNTFEDVKLPTYRGVIPDAVKALRKALNENCGEHVKIYVSSGFGPMKTLEFMKDCPESFDSIGTGSFIPKDTPTCTSDIMWVSGEKECKKGREWGYERDEFFSKNLLMVK